MNFMDVSLVLDLSKLCDQILNGEKAQGGIMSFDMKKKVNRKKRKEHMDRLCTITHLVNAGAGNTSFMGYPIYQDAERLLFVLKSVVNKNLDELLLSLHEDLLSSLEKCSRLSKASLRESYSYDHFTTVTSAKDRDRKRGVNVCLEKLYILDCLTICASSKTLDSESVLSSDKMTSRIRRALHNRDYLMKMAKEYDRTIEPEPTPR